MRLYVAAPLFTEAERAFNLVLTKALEIEGHQVYLPQRDTPSSTQETGRTTMIFHANLVALRNAEAVVAVSDGPQVDDGTASEVGCLRQEHPDLRATDGRTDRAARG